MPQRKERPISGHEPPTGFPRRLLTAEEVAAILNVDIRTVRRRIKDETLPVVRFGRLVRIRPEVLAALIEGEVT